MNRNCLFNKAIALLLCAVLVIGYLPSIALPADATTQDKSAAQKGITTDPNEGEADVVETTTQESTTGPAGAQDNPIFLSETSSEYEVGAGETVYFKGNFGGSSMTVTGAAGFKVIIGESEEEALDGTYTYGEVVADFEFAIQNTAETAQTYSIVFTYPTGSQNAPEEIELGRFYTATFEAQDENYFYHYKAQCDGTLQITISSEVGWQAVVGGDMLDSDAKGLEYTHELTVRANDDVKFDVNTLDGRNPTPAGTVTVKIAYKPIVDEELTFRSVGLSFQEYIGLQPLMDKTLVDSYDSLYIEAIQATPEGNVTEKLYGSDFYGVYYIYDKQLLSWSMTEEVTFTIYAEKDGVKYQSTPITTSVKNLALEKIAEYYNANNMKACRVLVDVLNYGAAVQTAFNHNASNLPNVDLGSYSALGTSETPAIDATNSTSGTGTIQVYKDAISMQSKVEIQMIYEGDVSAFEVRSTVGGVTTTVPSSAFVDFYGYKLARIAIKAANMREVHTIALYDPATGEPVTEVYSVSIEAYAKNQLGGIYNDVFITMMKYGDSVRALL